MRSLLRLGVVMLAAVALLAGAALTLPFGLHRLVADASSAEALPLAPLGGGPDAGATVYAADGTAVAVLHPPGQQVAVPLSAVPPVLQAAVLAAEDPHFFAHHPDGLLSEAASVSGLDGVPGGGEGIAEQLAEQEDLPPRAGLAGAVSAAVVAERLERHYRRAQLFAAYLNTVDLGEGAEGVEAGAERYWGEPVQRLDLAQAALLAGLIRSPVGDDPFSHPRAARRRRAEVLDAMLAEGAISPAAARAAADDPLPQRRAATPTAPGGVDGAYLAALEASLLGPGSPLGATPAERAGALFHGGLAVYSDLEPGLQAQAATALARAAGPAGGARSGVLVSITPGDGAVRALAVSPGGGGGAGRASALRAEPAGPAFEVVTLLAALGAGESIFDPVDAAAPCPLRFPGGRVLPGSSLAEGAGGLAVGETSVEEAVAHTSTCALLRMAHDAGLGSVVATAASLGFPPAELDAHAGDPGLAVGALPVTALQMAAAYAAVADGGTYHAPQLVARIVDRSGATIYQARPLGVEAVPTEAVAETDTVLGAALVDGPAAAADLSGQLVAGLGGATAEGGGAWFDGYTPELEATVWEGPPGPPRRTAPAGERPARTGPPVGAPRGTPSAAGAAAEAAGAYLQAVLPTQTVVEFPPIAYAGLPPVRPVPVVAGGRN